jgi:hypothetical protein
VTSADIAFRIQADLGSTWPRNRPLPNDVVAVICEALWQEGVNPNRRIVQQRMPVWNDHAFGPGIVAWRKRKGLSEQGTRVGYALPTNLSELAGHQSCNRPCAVDSLRSCRRWPLAGPPGESSVLSWPD